MKYDFKSVEEKWQKKWDEAGAFKAEDFSEKPKFFSMVEFPYPSGAGMHVGHIKAYSGLEVVSRKRRMQGYNVLFPIGFDAFGLPTENYAIKTNIHPRKVTDMNIAKFTDQLKKVGFSFDWSRVIDTTDEDYYKWTQWIFLKMFDNGLVFRDKALVNYCPSCKVVLSNEDSQGGKCDICHSDVIQKSKDVWYLRITKYADKLLDGLGGVDYLPNIKQQQINWIGKSTGAFVRFPLKNTDEKLTVYTTRPDTLFGVTFMVIAPEHPVIAKYRDRIKIEMMLREKASIQQIADRLHVTYQTIWRELRRDGVWYEHTLSNLTTERRYSADIAQAQYEKNKRAKGGMIKLGHDFALHDFIEQKIGREHYSPAAVIMEIKLRGLKFDVDICEKTIYNYINSGDVFFSITNKDLPQRGEHKREYKKVREAKRQAPGEGIENRPPEIDERKEEGHWEMDTVKGKKNGRKCALMLSERAMRTELVLPMAACTMECVVEKLDQLERRWGNKFSRIFKTITVDNGSEFMDYEGMMTSKETGERRTQVFYCHPYRSNERGTNENQNRMFRRFFPKGTDLDAVPDEDISAVQDWMNNYPRKLLGGKTAGMLFDEFVASLS